jgi:hypothetical protein
MRGKHVDQRVGLAARRLAILMGALALAGVLNVSGRSNRTATTANTASSPSVVAAAPQLPEAEAGSATLASAATRRLGPTLMRVPIHDVPRGFDHLATGTSS